MYEDNFTSLCEKVLMNHGYEHQCTMATKFIFAFVNIFAFFVLSEVFLFHHHKTRTLP